MRTIQIIGTLLLLVCLTGLSFSFGLADDDILYPNASKTPSFLPDPPYVDGTILVKAQTDPDGQVHSLSDLHAAIGATVVRDYGNVGISGVSLITLPPTMSVPDAIRYYSGNPDVAYAEPDYYVMALNTPDDPEFWRQWGLANTGSPFKENTTSGIAGADISAIAGWNETTGTNGTIIAVLDTGVDVGHPDLVDNLWTFSGSGTILHGINILENKPVEPWDDFGHGTHCAGIIGMVGSNGLGGTGVAWNTTIIPIKAMDYRGYGKLSDIALGMAYASLYNASIISCSFGTEYSRVMEDIIRQSPALFVCAAGNYGVDLNTAPQYPSCYNFSNVITIASTDAQDSLSWFSNYGNRTVHVAAPGSDIYSTVPSVYSYSPVFEDPEFSGQNFTLTGNWTLVQESNPGQLPYLHAVKQESMGNATFELKLNRTVLITDGTGDIPHLVWDTRGHFTGTQVMEYSRKGEIWTTLRDYEKKINETDWKQEFIPLNQVDPNSSITVRFRYIPKENSNADFSVRNIRIGYRGEVITPKYKYMDGTSMATPLVAGVAGLIKGKKPGLTAGEIREVIMDTADPLGSLQGKTITGARVNLSEALQSLKETDAIPLYPGWNHVSVPRRLKEGTDTAQIFSGVNSSGHSVLVYMNTTTGYRTLSMNDTIVPLQGYWIYSTGEMAVPVWFSDLGFPLSRELPAGWSSVGGWMETDLSANETLHTLMDAWSYATGYDAFLQQYEEPIFRGGSGNQSDKRPIRPYLGYWLYCSQNGTYQAGFG